MGYTIRKRGEFYTEVKRVSRGAIRQTTCCCAAPGLTPLGCKIAAGLKNPCRCACHKEPA